MALPRYWSIHVDNFIKIEIGAQAGGRIFTDFQQYPQIRYFPPMYAVNKFTIAGTERSWVKKVVSRAYSLPEAWL